MNFLEAVKAMKEGKKVKMAGWTSRGFLKKEADDIVDEDGESPLFISWIESTDWEVVEEEWKLSDKVISSIVDVDFDNHVEQAKKKPFIFYSNDVKTFIEKVKEDMMGYYNEHTPVQFIDIKKFVDIIDKRAGNIK